jgi:GNAT superfamily N-acetyltransferase
MEIAFRLLDGRQAGNGRDEFRAVHAEVYADPPYGWGEASAGYFARRFDVQCRQPGFVLAEARHGGYLVGFAFGLPLRPATDWWRGLTAPVPAELTAEYPGRSFAVAELLVRAPWRRQGIGETLHDSIIRDRTEERATAAVATVAVAAQGAFSRWGWRKVARKHSSAPGSPLLDVLVRGLHASSG